MVLLRKEGTDGCVLLDLRTRVLKDSDAGMASKLMAEKYAVSRASGSQVGAVCCHAPGFCHVRTGVFGRVVDRLKQRRRETGEIAPRRQTARLVFLDESGVRTDLVRRYGRGQRGERVVDHAPDSRWHTTTVLAALRVTGLTAPAVFDVRSMA